MLERGATDRERTILKRRMQKRAWKAMTTKGTMVVAHELKPLKLRVLPLQIFLCNHSLVLSICNYNCKHFVITL